MSQPLSGCLFGAGKLVITSSVVCSPPPTYPHTPPRVSFFLSPTQSADSRLMAGRPTGHVADAVLPPHGSTVRHLHLQTWWITQRVVLALRACLCAAGCDFPRSNRFPHHYTWWYLFVCFGSPLISLVNLTRCESVRGRGCSSMLWMSSTSHMNWMTGWAL